MGVANRGGLLIDGGGFTPDKWSTVKVLSPPPEIFLNPDEIPPNGARWKGVFDVKN
jgi:hypothetical protein